ncbi:MAG: epoxyqueuosine reductase QueH [Oscillospiraceae bacterium]|nr:epoxyqueuosine reductase QueH [Oscillospiraceae bacterium]
MKINYQLLCEKKTEELTKGGRRPSLLLHSCCGPCSTYVLEYLTKHFDVSILFYNPNIFPEKEYIKRLSAQREVLLKMNLEDSVKIIEFPYDYNEFISVIPGFEQEPEGGSRCTRCFELRLEKTVRTAKKLNFDCFATTLSVSPHKNAELLNGLGEKLGLEHGVEYLPADFKKREGYKRSVVLSKEYGIYRQEYCGCEFSGK